jgi:hypothetical protein
VFRTLPWDRGTRLTDGEVVSGEPAIMLRKRRDPLLVYGPDV